MHICDNPMKDYPPLPLPDPDPLDYRIFKTGSKGGVTFFPRNIIKYLGARQVVYDGPTPRIFNGRSYEVIREKRLDGMMTESVDAYMLDEMLSSSQMNSIHRNSAAILDFDKSVPGFEDTDEMEAYETSDIDGRTGGLFAFENGILNTLNG